LVVDKKTKRIICTHQSRGKTHDFMLFKKSKLPLNKGKQIKADSGYQGLIKIHANSELPLKRTKLHELTKKEKERNLKLSKTRVTIEHVIGKIKVFRILSERYRNRRKRYGIRMSLICGIFNFELK
jgi:DDE superfamily endonuclease